MLLTLDEKTEIVDLARSNSYRSTAAIFNHRHPDRPAPLHQSNVAALFQKLRKFGTLQRKKRTMSAHKAEERVALTSQIKRIYAENVHMSTRKAAAHLQKCHMTVWKTLKEIKFFPYKMSVCQKQRPNDPPTRKIFCEQLMNIFNQNEHFAKKILWSDEKLFRTSACFNRQINR